MKKSILMILSALLALVMLFTGCAGNADTETDDLDGTTVENDETTEGNKETDQDQDQDDTMPDPYVVKESYMPEAVSSQMKKIFEEQSATFITYTYGSCPYVMRDMYTISDCKLLSISIPVSKTLSADADGNFEFTITVGFNSWYHIQNSPRDVFTVYVNAEDYGLAENSTVNKWIKVDLTEYNIELSNLETLGFGKTTDTLIPAYMGSGDKNNSAQQLVEKSFPQMRGFISKMGLGQDIGTNSATLIYDFEWERTYESKEAYDAKVADEAEYQKKLAAVKQEYSGMNISILGDSISTYAGFSNNTSYNSTIGDNDVYYTTSGALNFRGLYNQTDTYWHRLINDLRLELCVNNSWSGSRVYNPSNKLQAPNRAGELDNDNGTPNDSSDDIAPDLIIFYMGINDLHRGEPKTETKPSEFGDLYALLESRTDKRSDKEKIAEWLAGIDRSNIFSFEQGYALCLEKMTTKYESAEIWCMTLNYNKDSRFDKNKLKAYNRCITALAEYFGCNVIDQTEGYITSDNCIRYSCDNKGLHPNPAGHALMERHIVETLYENLKNK